MRFSVVIPARDEAERIGACLDSIRVAAEVYPGEVETIVVLNRCTDGTEEIAHGRGARVVRDDRKNLAAIRNTGARAATGEILVTIDADSRMSANMLGEIVPDVVADADRDVVPEVRPDGGWVHAAAAGDVVARGPRGGRGAGG